MTGSQTPSSRRTWIAFGALALVVAILSAFAGWRYRVHRSTYYTDGESIRAPRADAPLRDILWRPPVALPAPINTDADEYEPRLSADGTTLFFVRNKPGANADIHLCRWVPEGWSVPEPLTGINTAEHDELGPEPSSDGRTLYFYSDRPGGLGGYDLWLSRLDPQKGTWSLPENLGPNVNTTHHEYSPALTPDGQTLYFASNRPRPGEAPPLPRREAWLATVREDLVRHDYDLYSAPLTDAGWGEAAALAGLNTPHDEGTPAVSPAGDFLYFASDRPRGDQVSGGFDLYRARRLNGEHWPTESLREPVNTFADELDPALSMGGFSLHFSSTQLSLTRSVEAADSSIPSVASGHGDEEALPRYDLFVTTSREVFSQVDRREAAMDWWALWNALWPWLLLLALLLLLLLLLRRLAADERWKTRWRRMSLLAKCLLVSAVAHALLMLLFAAWRVYPAVSEFLRNAGAGRGIEVAIVSHAGDGDALSRQIRGSFTDAPIVTLATDTPRLEIEAPSAPAPAPTVLHEPSAVASEDAAMPVERAMRETQPALADLVPVEPLDAPSSSIRPLDVATPREAFEREASAEANPAVQPRHSMLLEELPRPEPDPAAESAASIARLAPATVERSREAELPLADPVDLARDASTASTMTAPPIETRADDLLAGATEAPAFHPRVPSAESFSNESAQEAVSTVPTAGAAALSGPTPRLPDSESVAAPQLDAATPPVSEIVDTLPAAGSSLDTIAREATTAGDAEALLPSSAIPAAIELTDATTPPAFGLALPEVEAAAASSSDSGGAEPAHPNDELGVALPNLARALDAPRPGLGTGSTTGAATTPEAVALKPAATPASSSYAAAGSSAPAFVASADPNDAAPATRGTLSLDEWLRDATLPLTPPASGTGAADLALALPTDPEPTENSGEGDADPMYPQRASEEAREALAEEGGGGQETEQAVAMALNWLARHQSADGHWSGRTFDDECGRCGGIAAYDFDNALTGLSLLCFLGAGHTHADDGPYRERVRQGLQWLVSRQSESGDLRRGETMYSHGIAAIALCEAYGMTRDPELAAPAMRAIQFIARARDADGSGGWRYEPGEDGDTSVLGWQVMALVSAERAGLPVAEGTLDAAARWLDRVSREEHRGLYSYQPGMPPTASMTAEAMFVQQLLGLPGDDPRMVESADFVLSALPDWSGEGDSDTTYAWYYATLALYQHRGEAWDRWNEALVRELLAHQEAKGPEAGSWNPKDRWSRIGGRVYQTAICTLSLEVYYRYLPRYMTTETAAAAPPRHDATP